MLVKPEDDMSRPEASGAAVDGPPDSAPDSPPDSAPVVACVRALVQESGLRLSPAAIRELTDRPAAEFGPLEAVSALRNCGFDATGGKLPARRIAEGHCPLIAFRKDGAPMVVFAVDATAGTVTCGRPEDGFAQAAVPAAAFAADYAGFAILAKNRPDKRAAAGTRNWFWNALGEGRWLYAQVLVAAAMSNILGLSSALFIMVVYDRVVPNEAIESLIALTVGVLIALGFDFVIKTLRANFIDKAGKRADLRMSRMIFDKILSMRLEKRSKRSGALASIVREFETLRDFFTSATLVTVVDLPFVFFFIWVISLIAGPLALVPLVAVPLVIVTGLVIQPFLARLTSGSMETTQSKQAVLVETLNGIETVQATGAGRLMRQRFEDAVESQSELGLRSRILSQFAVNSAASVQQLCQIGIIFYGVFLIQEDVITMGAMIAAVILSGRTLAPLTQLAAALSRANNARQAYRALNALMTEDADTGRGVPLSRPSLNGSIELHEIGYRFPGSSSLLFKDLSLTIPAGQKVAILGRMGSGKSTLARLMAGLATPETGAVSIDGVDLRQLDRSDLRRNVGVMLQETWLFSGSVRENIQVGNYQYDDAHVLGVCKVSGVDDFIAGHPNGYDMLLKENGEGLSGGQRQSINLARALLHHPSVLILDEPTSSMDSTTEKLVIDRLKTWLTPARTLVVVTHRNSLLSLVDRVIVLDRGTVAADTTPEMLQTSLARRA